MGDLKYLLPILVAVILVWITYLVINFVATIIKTKKKDDTMVCGLNMQGKILCNHYCYLFNNACLLYLLHDYAFIKWRC